MRRRLLGTVFATAFVAAALPATRTQAQVVGGDGVSGGNAPSSGIGGAGGAAGDGHAAGVGGAGGDVSSGLGGGPFGGSLGQGGGNGGRGSANYAGGGGGPGSGGGGALYSYVNGQGGGGGGGGTGVTTGSNFTATVNVTGGNGGAGGSGGDSANASGGGGGGNGIAFVGSGTISVHTGVTVLGGNGGTGGTNGYIANIGGGGGGGGYGFSATSSVSMTNAGTIRGGNGGVGGRSGTDPNGHYYSSSGGGGTGVFMSGGGTIINTGTITGGVGGSGTSTAPGAGGPGIKGAGLAITNQGGTITGGLSGDGVTQAFAIVLTSGTNSVGTGGTIDGGIHVVAGSLMPAAPGSTAGTPLIINGPLTFESGSKYVIRITPTANDSAVVTGAAGTATLTGASVVVQAGLGTYAAGTRTILTATTLGGTVFSGATANFAFLTPTLSYDPTHVFLTIAAGTATAPAITTTDQATGVSVQVPDYRTAVAAPDSFGISGTGNQISVAAGLTNAAIESGGKGRVLAAFNQLTLVQARAALDSVSGEGIIAGQEIAHRSAELFTAAMFDQMTFYGVGVNDADVSGNSITLTAPLPAFSAYAPTRDLPIHELADLPSRAFQPAPVLEPSRTWRAWGAGFGGIETVHGNDGPGTATQTESIYGGALGVDYQLTPNYRFGMAVGGSDGSFSVPARTTNGSTTGGHIGFYDLATFGRFYAASSVAFTEYTNTTTRLIPGFGGLATETERGDFGSHEIRSRLEVGRHLASFGGGITPFVAMEMAELRSNGFSETSLSGPGLLRLSIAGQSTASVPSFVGARFQRILSLGNGMKISPTVEVSYIHDFAPQRSDFGAISGLPGSTFLVDGARPAYDSVRVKAGGELALNAHSVLFGNFVGEVSGSSEFYALKGGFRYIW